MARLCDLGISKESREMLLNVLDGINPGRYLNHCRFLVFYDRN
jgi:hypothetical protein|tara:strand:+ start:18 stop:146 length:129 start_codon:yes stop_codon:yes gene_type:complete